MTAWAIRLPPTILPLALTLIAPPLAHAWEFDEHAEIGSLAFDLACHSIEGRLREQLRAQSKLRDFGPDDDLDLGYACLYSQYSTHRIGGATEESGTEVDRLLRGALERPVDCAPDSKQRRCAAPGRLPESVCRFAMVCARLRVDGKGATSRLDFGPQTVPRRARSRRYGQSCGVAADHLDSPEAFLEDDAGKVLPSKLNLALLALTNPDHFHPAVLRNWRKYLHRAVKTALYSHSSAWVTRNGGVGHALEWALTLSAFANHYAQDAYAAGHLGFNRPASGASAAKVFHDYRNAQGLEVVDTSGTVWRTYGDGSLGACQSGGTCYERVIRASADAAAAVIGAFVFGEYAPDQVALLSQRVPVAARSSAIRRLGFAAYFLVDVEDRPVADVRAGDIPHHQIGYPTDAFHRRAYPAMVYGGQWRALARPMSPAGLAHEASVYAEASLTIPTRLQLEGGLLIVDGEISAASPRAGVVTPLGVTTSGLFSHEFFLETGPEVPIANSARWAFLASTGYILNMELAFVNLRLETMIGYRSTPHDLVVGIGLGLNFYSHASGGGYRFED